MFKTHWKWWLCLGPCLLAGVPALGAELAGQRQVTVTGDAEVRVAPDKAVITLGVETWNKDLEKACQENDDRVKKTLALLKANQVTGGDMQTGYFTLEPTYETHYDQHNNPTKKVLAGYTLNKTITVTVRDLSKFEKILSAVQKDGANTVGGLEFQCTELRKYRDQARAQAVRAAKEKAEALAHEIGQSIGRASAIVEERSSPWYAPRAQNVSQNQAGGGGGDDAGENTLAPGKISVNAQVMVTFDLL
jgi:uncharacterized protein